MRLAGLQKVAFLADYTKCSAFATVHESCHDPHATSRNVISGSRAAAKCRNARLSRRHLRPLHYGLMLAALITLPHFSVSSRMNFANSAGELGNTSAPAPCQLSGRRQMQKSPTEQVSSSPPSFCRCVGRGLGTPRQAALS